MSTATLGDLLLEEPRLRPLTEGAASTVFEGICTSEDDIPAGWLVIHQQGSAPVNRGLLRSVNHAAGIVWLGSGPPAEFISAASRASFPVLKAEATLRRIDVYAAARNVQSQHPDAAMYRRLRAVERLNPALLAENPAVALVEQYAAMVGESVAVISTTGKVLAQVGALPSRTVARRLLAGRETETAFELGRWLLDATVLGESDTQRALTHDAWLVRGTRSGKPPHKEDPVAATLANLLHIYFETQRRFARNLFADASVFLEGFTGAEADQEKIAAFLAAHGFSSEAHLRLVVAGGESPKQGAVFAERIAQVAAQARVPVIVGFIGNAPAVLTTANDYVSRMGAQLGTVAGGSAPFHAHDGASQALRQARIAAYAASLSGVPMRLIDDCGPTIKAASMLTEFELYNCVRELDDLLKDIAGAPELVQALVRSGFSTGKAAKMAEIHPNTVRNKLEKIRAFDLTDSDLYLWELWRATGARRA